MMRPLLALGLTCLLLCAGLGLLTLLSLALDSPGMRRLILPAFGVGLLVGIPLSSVVGGRLVQRFRS